MLALGNTRVILTSETDSKRENVLRARQKRTLTGSNPHRLTTGTAAAPINVGDANRPLAASQARPAQAGAPPEEEPEDDEEVEASVPRGRGSQMRSRGPTAASKYACFYCTGLARFLTLCRGCRVHLTRIQNSLMGCTLPTDCSYNQPKNCIVRRFTCWVCGGPASI